VDKYHPDSQLVCVQDRGKPDNADQLRLREFVDNLVQHLRGVVSTFRRFCSIGILQQGRSCWIVGSVT